MKWNLDYYSMRRHLRAQRAAMMWMLYGTGQYTYGDLGAMLEPPIGAQQIGAMIAWYDRVLRNRVTGNKPQTSIHDQFFARHAEYWRRNNALLLAPLPDSV